MLDRIDAVIAALEQGNEEYKLYEISPQDFKQHMRETKSKGTSAGKVGIVRKIVFKEKSIDKMPQIFDAISQLFSDIILSNS